MINKILNYENQLLSVALKSCSSGCTLQGIYESSYPLDEYLFRARFNARSLAILCSVAAIKATIKTLKITGPDMTIHRHKNLNIVFNMEAPL
jgi:hypothetical protein